MFTLWTINDVTENDQLESPIGLNRISPENKGKVQSSEQGSNLRVAIIDTGYLKKPNFLRL